MIATWPGTDTIAITRTFNGIEAAAHWVTSQVGGYAPQCFMLKRNADIPVSKSLPTVTMDKALDLMPALFIMVIVPLLGVQMDIKLWFVLWFVGGILVSLLFFVLLSAWKRDEEHVRIYS